MSFTAVFLGSCCALCVASQPFPARDCNNDLVSLVWTTFRMKNLTDFACLLCLVIGYHAAPILCHPGQSKLDPDSTRLGDRRLQPVPLHADPVASVPVDDGLESSTHVEARSLRAAAASFDRLRARGQERQCEPLKASPGGDPRCYIITKLELGLKLSDGTGDIIGARLDSTAGDTAFDIVSGPSAGFQGWKTVDWTRSFSRNEIVIGSINKLYLTAEGRMGTPPPWNDAFKVQGTRPHASRNFTRLTGLGRPRFAPPCPL